MWEHTLRIQKSVWYGHRIICERMNANSQSELQCCFPYVYGRVPLSEGHLLNINLLSSANSWGMFLSPPVDYRCSITITPTALSGTTPREPWWDTGPLRVANSSTPIKVTPPAPVVISPTLRCSWLIESCW